MNDVAPKIGLQKGILQLGTVKSKLNSNLLDSDAGSVL